MTILTQLVVVIVLSAKAVKILSLTDLLQKTSNSRGVSHLLHVVLVLLWFYPAPDATFPVKIFKVFTESSVWVLDEGNSVEVVLILG